MIAAHQHWLAGYQRIPAWRGGIGVAALDHYRGYASALRASRLTRRVLDAFHVVLSRFAAVDRVRCWIQAGTDRPLGPQR